MNFHSFTGHSRKTRNVNLSGQRTTNPFSQSASWSQASSSGPSKSVVHAQAERQQRQHERDRLKSALHIQRLWRGHRVRRLLRDRRRQQLDDLYRSEPESRNARSREAVPLALAVIQPTRADDRARLAALTDDLIQTTFDCFGRENGAIPPSRKIEFGRLLIAAWDEGTATSADSVAQTEVYLHGILHAVNGNPRAYEKDLGRLYKVMGRFCRDAKGDRRDKTTSWHVVRALVMIPLQASLSIGDGPGSDSFRLAAYRAFILSFLTQPDIVLFEKNVAQFSPDIDLDRLSKGFLAIPPDDVSMDLSSKLWALAHFVALQGARKCPTLPPIYLQALYMHLSAHSHHIRVISSEQPDPKTKGHSRDDAKGSQSGSSPYIARQLTSLVDMDEVTSLLNQFIERCSKKSTDHFEDTSLLAGYLLLLIQCFPKQADDIRMKLFLADIYSREGDVPAIKYFWTMMERTGVFSSIVTNEANALPVLRRERTSESSAAAQDSQRWDREWRIILLTLDLYTFILRLTDDDDFFIGLATPLEEARRGPRLRSTGITGPELHRFSLFLKHLGFNLYYNATEILEAASGQKTSQSSISDLLNPSGPRSSSAAASNDVRKAATFNIAAGINFSTFRAIVTTPMRMLYERDSRRPFLPKGHWLMVSKFDMEGFLSAVVLEEQRQHQLRESGEDEGDGGDDESGDNESDIDEDDYSTLQLFGDGQTVHRLGQRRSRKAQLERFRIRQKRAVRERLLASIAPRLEILRNMPFVIPFETRVQIFRQFVHLDKERRRGGNIDPDQWRMWVINQNGGPWDQESRGRDILSRHHAEIKRGRVFSDAIEDFYELGDGLKEPIQITFVDEFGMQEAGIDGGGVTKEFLTCVTKEAFSSEAGLFVANSKNMYYPNPCAVDQQKEALRTIGVPEDSESWRESMADLMRQMEFLGRIIGKCMYEGILVDIVFAGFFLLKWSGSDMMHRANVNDLYQMDDELYKGMLHLKSYPGDVSELGLDFTISDQISLPGEPVRTVTRPLIPGGEDIPVTNENRPLYISYVARHRLVHQPHAQTRAFLRGLGLIIDPAWLSMFNQSELQRLVGGDSRNIDVKDLRRHTAYSGVYAVGNDGVEHPTIQMFWQVMHEFSDAERRDVLKFVTSTPRAPLLGFGQLNPPFSIRDGGNDEERLPSASTCVNLLKLPVYRSAEVLKQKLLYAIKSGAGFDLS